MTKEVDMQYISRTHRLVALFLLLLPLNASAEWTLVGNTLNASNSQSARFAYLALNNGTPYVTWVESTAGRDQVYAKFWNGSSWQSLGGSLNTNTGEHAYSSQLAFNNNTPYAAYSEAYTPDTAQHVYVKRWNGAAWNTLGGVLNVNPLDYATSPSLAFSPSGTLYVAWSEQVVTYTRVYVKHFNGSAWVQDGTYLNIDANRHATNPSLVFSGDRPVVAWGESTATSSDLRVKALNGTAWEALGNSVNTAGHYSYQAWLAVDNNTLYAAFAEDNDTSYIVMGDIFVARVKEFNGTSWQDVGGILNTDVAHPAYLPRLAFAGGTPYVAFNEDYNFDFMGITKDHHMQVKRYTSGSWSQFDGDLNLASNEYVNAGSIAISGNSAYVAWSESSGAFQLLHVKTDQLPLPTPTATPSGASSTPTPGTGTLSGAIVQAYPNPAKDQMRFRFSLSAPALVRLQIYNLAGEQVASLEEQMGAGNGWVLTWSLKDTAPGVYLVQVLVDGKAKEEIKVAVMR
jgi:hypothetical protein